MQFRFLQLFSYLLSLDKLQRYITCKRGMLCFEAGFFPFTITFRHIFFISCISELSDFETCVYHIYFVPPIPVQCQHSLYLCESCPLRTIATPKHKYFTKVSRKMQYIPFQTSFHHISVKMHHAIFGTILMAKMPSAITRILVIADLGWSAISFGLSIMKSLIVAYALVMAVMERRVLLLFYQ